MSITDGARGNDQQQLRARLAATEARANDLPARFATQMQHGINRRVRQTAHGFTIGTAVRFDGTNWVASKADTDANAVVVGLVVAVPHANAFVIERVGYIRGLTGLTPGVVYYLSAATAGALTTTAPAIAVPILIAESASTAFLLSLSRKGVNGVGLLLPTSLVYTTIPYNGTMHIYAVGGGGAGDYRTDLGTLGYVATTSGGSPTRHLRKVMPGPGGGSGARIFAVVRVLAGQTVTKTVGAGGSAAGGNGTATTVVIDGTTIITAGGGQGGNRFQRRFSGRGGVASFGPANYNSFYGMKVAIPGGNGEWVNEAIGESAGGAANNGGRGGGGLYAAGTEGNGGDGEGINFDGTVGVALELGEAGLCTLLMAPE